MGSEVLEFGTLVTVDMTDIINATKVTLVIDLHKATVLANDRLSCFCSLKRLMLSKQLRSSSNCIAYM